MRETWAWCWFLGALLAAGCCGTSDALTAVAADNVTAWGLALEYVRDHGRADDADAKAARERTLSRCVAWGVQADAIVAGLADDADYDAAKAYARWAVRATEKSTETTPAATPAPTAGAEGPGPSPAPAGAETP